MVCVEFAAKLQKIRNPRLRPSCGLLLVGTYLHVFTQFVGFLQLAVVFDVVWHGHTAAEEGACEAALGIAVNPAGEACFGTFG